MNSYDVGVTRYQGIQEWCRIRVEASDEWEARAKAGLEAESNMDLSWDFVDGWDLAGYDKEYTVTPVIKVWTRIDFKWLGIALLETVAMCCAIEAPRTPHPKSTVWITL